jgi:hypothetical protein
VFAEAFFNLPVLTEEEEVNLKQEVDLDLTYLTQLWIASLICSTSLTKALSSAGMICFPNGCSVSQSYLPLVFSNIEV